MYLIFSRNLLLTSGGSGVKSINPNRESTFFVISTPQLRWCIQNQLMHGQDNYHTLELVNQSSEKPVLRSWRVSTVRTVNGCFFVSAWFSWNLKIYTFFALIDIACSRIFKTYQQKSEGGILPFVKGQTNSKWFFQTDVSSNKRMNKFNFTTCRLVFVRFSEEREDTKKTFRN